MKIYAFYQKKKGLFRQSVDVLETNATFIVLKKIPMLNNVGVHVFNKEELDKIEPFKSKSYFMISLDKSFENYKKILNECKKKEMDFYFNHANRLKSEILNIEEYELVI